LDQELIPPTSVLILLLFFFLILLGRLIQKGLRLHKSFQIASGMKLGRIVLLASIGRRNCDMMSYFKDMRTMTTARRSLLHMKQRPQAAPSQKRVCRHWLAVCDKVPGLLLLLLLLFINNT